MASNGDDGSQAGTSTTEDRTNPETCIRELKSLDLKTGSQLSQLELVLLWPDKIRSCMRRGDFTAALAIMEKREKLDPRLKNVNQQLLMCIILAATTRNAEYSRQKQALFQLIRDKINPLPTDLLQLAKQHIKEGNALRAIILFDVCYNFVLTAKLDPYTKLSWIEDCLDGMGASITHVGEESPIGKRFLGNIFVPKMEEMVEKLREIPNIEIRYMTLKIASVSHDLELSDPNTSRSISNISSAVEMMREVLGEAAKNYTIFGTLLNNLAATYEKEGNMEQALNFYIEALESYKLAKDYKSEEIIKSFITKGERRVRQAAGDETEVFPGANVDVTTDMLQEMLKRFL